MLDYDLLVHAPAHLLWLLASLSLVVSFVNCQLVKRRMHLIMIYFSLTCCKILIQSSKMQILPCFRLMSNISRTQ